MNLSANFTLKELTKSDTATRLGLDNTPDEQALAELRVMATAEAIAEELYQD